MPDDLNNAKLMRRLLRWVKEANTRYISIDINTIREAMVSAIKEYLDTCFGNSNIIFDAYWHLEEKVVIIKQNMLLNTSEYFDFGGLSEFRIREIIALFNRYLDNSEAIKDYELLKGLRGGLIYGQPIRYENNIATINFYDSEGYERYGFCVLRDLLPHERNSEILTLREPIPFMVKRIRYLFGKTRCELRLTRLSIRLPELLLSESLQENGYKIEDYHFKCVRRIGGIISLIGSINFIPKPVLKELREKSGKEFIRVFAFKKSSNQARAILSGASSWETTLAQYFNISTVKQLYTKTHSDSGKTPKQKLYLPDSFISRLKKVNKG